METNITVIDLDMPVRTVPPEIEKELTIRLYRWALQDAEREVMEDFPLVLTIQNAAVYGFLAYCSTKPKKDIIEICMTRVKAFHSYALSALGEAMTSEEQNLMSESYKNQLTHYSLYTEEFNQRVDLSEDRSTKAEVTALLKEAMRPAFGERQPSRFKVVSIHENDFPQKSTLWRLQTWIEALHKQPNMGYAQSLYLPEHEWALTTRHPSHRATDILGWLGITPLPTYWDIPLKSDVEPAVASLALVTKHYLDAIPSIIEGLSL